MRRLSPNSLFHFTSSFENMLGILEDTFYPRYCYEEFDLVARGKGKGFMKNAFPMVCFCDITLSQLTSHIATYGRYGFGMKKEWGIRNGLNPVIYFNRDSHMAKSFVEVVDQVIKIKGRNVAPLGGVTEYLKPYKGNLYRGGRVTKKDVRFYDEHEWRYVPDIVVMKKHGMELTISAEMYRQSKKLKDANKKLERDETRLAFDADDIKYIIIDKESEINEMIGKLKAIKGSKYNFDTVERLASRIITVKQIEEDF